MSKKSSSVFELSEIRSTLIRIAFIAAAAVICVSCATIGNDIDFNYVDEMVPGQTTMKEATEVLGPPMVASAMDDGSMLYQWQYSKVRIGGGSLGYVAIIFDDQGTMIKLQEKGSRNVGMF